jgi:MarR family transcriptional regulator, multiple antibiotic resistance protein MarR
MGAMTADEDVRASLHRFGLARGRLSAAVCQASGLNATELEALEYLEEDGPLTQRELADRLRLTSGGTTLLVDRLERAGFVVRRPHPSDRRAVQLELNPGAGGRVSAPLDGYHTALMAAASQLSDAEREAVCRFLDAATAAEHQTAQALSTDKRRRHERRPRGAGRLTGARAE